MKLIRLLLIISAIIPFAARSQGFATLTIQMPSPLGANLGNVLNPIITSTYTSTKDVFIHSSILGLNNALIGEYTTNSFMLNSGTMTADYTTIGISSTEFYDLQFESAFFATGYFPVGEYTICIQLIENETGKILSEKCLTTRSSVLSPPRLVFPKDQSELRYAVPIFNWLPVVSVNSIYESIFYQITIKEKLSVQSPYEAMANNVDYHNADNLASTFYIYPAGINLGFEVGQQYVWQVKAFSGDNFVGESEIWEFTPVIDSLLAQELAEGSYAVAQKELNSSFYITNGTLRFQFEGQYAPKSLTYKIYSDLLEDITPSNLELLQKLGDNRYSMSISGLTGIHHKSFYTLEISNEKHEKFYVRFRYVDPYATY